MRVNRSFQLMLVLGLLLQSCRMQSEHSELTDDPVQILTISTRVEENSSLLSGSLKGGTSLYMKVVGLDQNSANNKVFIGSYPCLVADKGVNGIYLSCDTPELDTEMPLLNQNIQIWVSGKRVSTCLVPKCSFDFNKTPTLDVISPRSAFSASTLNWSGNFMGFAPGISLYTISNMLGDKSDVKSMRIGDTICDRFMDERAEVDTSFRNGGWINCTVSADIVAGLYDGKIKMVDGFTKNKAGSFGVDVFSGKLYNVMILPLIREVSIRNISPFGARVRLDGNGFGVDPSKIQVKYGGVDAKLLTVSTRAINIEVPDLQNVALQNVGQPGLRHTRYSITSLTGIAGVRKFRNQIRLGTVQGVILQDGFLTESETAPNGNEPSHFQYIRGWYVAPRNGQYRFQISGDYSEELWLSSVPNSLDRSNMVLRAQASTCPFRDPWSCFYNNPQTNPNSVSEYVTLQQGQEYYMEIFHHHEGTGQSYVTASVEVPSSKTEFNSQGAIQRIETRHNGKLEIHQIRVYNQVENRPLNATFTLLYPLIMTRIGIPIDFDSDNVAEDLRLSILRGCQFVTNVTAQKLDFNGLPLPDNAAQYAGHLFTITYLQHRQSLVRFVPRVWFTSIPSTQRIFHSVVVTQLPDTAITGGTFKISMDGTFVWLKRQLWREDLWFDLNHEELVVYLDEKFDCQTRSFQTGTGFDGFSMYFQCTNPNAKTPRIASGLSSLVSGTGITTSLSAVIVQAISTNQIFEPISVQMLRQVSAAPQIQVWVNGIQGLCQFGQCNLSKELVSSIPQITSYTLTGFALTIDLSSLGVVDSQDLDVQFGRGRCFQILVSTNRVTCQMENLNNKVVMEAGTHRPIISSRNVGYFSSASTVPSRFQTLTLLTATPNRGSLTGGTIVRLIGEGFNCTQEGVPMTLRIGSANLRIISANNQEIVVIMPSQPADNNNLITITYNGQTATISYVYDAARTVLITSVTPIKSSPYIRRSITVVGNNFGTDRTQISAYLQNKADSTKRIDMGIVNVTNTQVVVRFPGGRVGDYDLVIFRADWGVSRVTTSENQNDFQLSISMGGVGPRVVSLGGGTLITINGENFDPTPHETQVVIGEQQSWLCEIQRMNETQIQCIVPPKHSTVAPDTLQPIYIITRLNEYATVGCTIPEDCRIQYTNLATPQLNLPPVRLLLETEQPVHAPRFLFTEETKKPGPNHLKNFFHPFRNLQQMESTIPQPTRAVTYTPGLVYTFTGTRFGSNPTLWIGDNPIRTFRAISDTSLQFEFPVTIVAGSYLLRLEIPGLGFASNNWLANVVLFATGNIDTLVSQGGQVITIPMRSISITGQYPVYVELQRVVGFQKVANLDCFHINQVLTTQNLLCRTPILPDPAIQYRIQIFRFDPYTNRLLTVNFDRRFQSSPTITPTINSVSSSSLTGLGTIEKQFVIQNPSNIQLTLNGVRLNFTARVSVYFINQQNRVVANGTIVSNSESSLVVSFPAVDAGRLRLNVVYDNRVFAFFSNEFQQFIQIYISDPKAQTIISSFMGGNKLTITGSGFSNVRSENQVLICGQNCQVTQSNLTLIECTIPPLITAQTEEFYKEEADRAQICAHQFTITTDTLRDGQLSADGLQSTFYQSRTGAQCFIQYDFNDNRVKLQQIRYMPRVDFQTDLLIGTSFEYTFDGENFQTLFELDSLVHSSWNFEVPENTIQGIRAIRFNDPTGASGCQLAEVEFYGWLYYYQDVDLSVGRKCNAQVFVNGAGPINAIDAVHYQRQASSIVSSLSPQYGPSNGGTILTLNGQFTFGTPRVFVDDVECVVEGSPTLTQVQCRTGNKDNINSDNKKSSFVVSFDGNRAAIQCQPFIYANRFSAEETWGGDIAPREGDTIVVPTGQTLLMDMTPPKLYLLIVEGSLIFEDGKDLELQANFILIRDGKFEAGTEQKPRRSKLSITMHGNFDDKQLPHFGNKVIACHQCVLDIHGERRTPTWTDLEVTAERGATEIRLMQNTDWRVGEEIVITSTGWNHLETERRFIQSISIDGKIITFREPLTNRHYSAVEVYGNKQFPMRCEVGLLTRNIVIQGDSKSDQQQYGAHLMIHGQMRSGSIGRIEYAQFRNVGQPRIIGRYPIHFHLNGEMYDSYVIGNSIHDSFARCITIHGTHYLRVSKNVGYNFHGHGIFMEDGIETNNVITENLIAGGKQSWIMLQQDITVSTYWITNPYNTVRDNRSGGSEWYGFWYEIKSNPDGPSARSDICPPGLKIKDFSGNRAHSNGQFGLRIFKLFSRKFPCRATQDWNREDPFSSNPSIESVFENFSTFQNAEAGVLGEEIGNVKFRNIMVADSKYAGFQTHRTNFTRIDEAQIDDFLIVGFSRGNANRESWYNNAHAIVAPRTDGFLAQNVQIYNFYRNMTLLQSCSQCNNFRVAVVGGKNTKFRNITVDLSAQQARKIRWFPVRNEIFWDLDGSLTGAISQLTPMKPHLENIPGCQPRTEVEWDQTLICRMDQVKLRDVLINKPQPNFQGRQINFQRDSPVDNKTTTVNWIMIMPKNRDTFDSYAQVLATGQTYTVVFQQGTDWNNIAVRASQQFDKDEPGFVLRFKYFGTRETYEINRLVGGRSVVTYTNVGRRPNPNTCNNGEWWIDQNEKFLYLCVSGRNYRPAEYIAINSVICATTCTVGVKEVPKEAAFRRWSNAANWPNGVLPVAGATVTIPPTWKLILDVDTPILNHLLIDGDLYFDETRPSLHLQSHTIWARGGSIFAGESGKPYLNNLTITLHGNVNSATVVIDRWNDASSKVLVATKTLRLVGRVPGTVWTRLAAFADAGATFIDVLEARDWRIGEEIVVGPSGNIYDQHERFTIQRFETVSPFTRIHLNRALVFNHFGAPTVTLRVDAGELDMRAVVGHLTRNIVIQGSQESTNWGCRVMVFQYYDQANLGTRRGAAQIEGVEFINCGQKNTDRAGLNFVNLNDWTQRIQSIVVGNSFHDSNGPLFGSSGSHDVLVENNFFFNGRRFLAQMFAGHNNRFINNALVYSRKDIESPTWGALADFVGSSSFWHKDQVQITSNVAQGSEGAGILQTLANCDASQNGIKDNTVSAIAEAGFVFRTSHHLCVLAEGVKAFHCRKAFMGTIATNELRVERLILVENQIGMNFRPTTNSQYSSSHLQTNWFISALARPDCPKCYHESFGSICRNQIGYLMGATESTPQQAPISKNANLLDVFCSIQLIDCRIFLTNSQFHNFKATYANIPQCANNNIFRQHSDASDSVCSNFLTNTTCRDCEKTQLFSFVNPNPAWRGWFGGCGSFDCTGQWNVIVQDTDGRFLGSPSQVIPNNPWFGPSHSNCLKNDRWNGYECSGNNFIVLEWMSIAPDYNGRLFSPVFIRNQGRLTNQINSFREWAWAGPEPANRRESKFLALVDLFSTIDMENAGQNPSDAHFWLQKRSHSTWSPDWVIIRLKYSTPQIVQVLRNNNQMIPSFPIGTNDTPVDLRKHTNYCGANNYFYKLSIIEFVLTPDCVLRLRQVNNLLITTHLSFDYDAFLRNDRFGSFVTKVVAFLNIDPSKVRIVGHAKSLNGRLLQTGTAPGETDISVTINTDSPVGQPNTASGTYDPSIFRDQMQNQTNLFDTDQRKLTNSLAELKSDIDTRVEMQYLAMSQNVLQNATFTSTETKDTRSLDLIEYVETNLDILLEQTETQSLIATTTENMKTDSILSTSNIVFLGALSLAILILFMRRFKLKSQMTHEAIESSVE